MKKLGFTFWLCACFYVGLCQNINRIEYFIDTEPGFGNGTSISFVSSPQVNDVTFSVPVNSISDGFHILFVRSRDTNNKWSVVQAQRLYKVPNIVLAAAPNLNRIEYYVDTDPGYGSGTSVAFTPGASVTDLVFSLDVSSLTQGAHKLYVRSRDANNKWSIIQIKDFSVCNQAIPVTAAATSITTTGFTANWAVATGATSYRLDVSADNFATFVSGNNDRSITAGTTATVTGLTIGTAYKYRVRAVNATCTSISSAAIDVTTLFTAPSATAATLVNATGFRANWNAVTGAASYRIDISADNFSTFVTGYNNKTVTTTNEVVTGLAPSTAYKYRVRAVSAGTVTSGNSNEITVTTLALPVAPTANAATAISSTGFTANWNTVAGATGYRLDVSADNFTTFVTGFNDKTVTTLNDIVAGLTAATAYKYRVRTVNANGTSVNSNVIDVTTSASGTAPAAPTAAAATAIAASGFTANWNTVVGATGYQLDISADNFLTLVAGYNSKVVTATTDVVAGLTASTAYKYRVRATNASGTSANSNVIDVTTGAVAPPPVAPVASAATSINATRFTTNWNAVSGGTSYEVDVSSDNFVTFIPGYPKVIIPTSGSVTPAHMVAGLTPSTAYKYRVRAINASGTSTNSNVIDVTTLALAAEPTAQPTAIVFTNTSSAFTTVSFTGAPSTPTGYIVVSRPGAAPTSDPVDGTGYVIGSALGDGIVAFAGSATTFFSSKLAASTTHHYKINSYNGNSGVRNYRQTSPLTGNVLTSSAPAPLGPYVFAQTAGTYSEITTGTVLGSPTDDEALYLSSQLGEVVFEETRTGTGFPIGFPFSFNGQSFDRFGASTNGYIKLGTGTFSMDNNYYGPQASFDISPTGNDNTIMPLANDLVGTATSSIRYLTQGTAPSRVLIVQWRNFSRFVGTDNINFQVRLYESTNNIEFVYGAFALSQNQDLFPSVGFRGTTSNNFNQRSVINGTHTWSTSVASSTYNASCAFLSTLVPAAGLTYRWQALPLAPVATAAVSISPTGFTANWNAVGGATGYQLDISSDNFATFLTGYNSKAITAITEVVAGLSASTAYKYRVRATNASGASANSNVIDVTTGTAGTAPTTPVATAATNVSTTGFTANWNVVTGATGYQLDISGDNFNTFVTGYNSKAVTVANEVVAGLTAGTAYKYRVRAANASGTSANSNVIDVTTLAKQNQTITFLAIADKTLGGATFTIGATATSGLAVSYATASDKITIANGVATLVKAGRETIEASQAGNATFNAATTVTQSFCIKPAKPTITSSGNNTETVTLTSSAATGNQWFKDGTAISGATNATLSVTAAAVGVYKVQAKADDCLSEFSTDFPIIVTGDLPSTPSGISVSPNPVEEVLEISGIVAELKNYELFDLAGRAANIVLEKRTDTYTAPVRHLSQGMYVLRLHVGDQIQQVKFVKK